MFHKSLGELAVIASSMLLATAQVTPLPAVLFPEDLIFTQPLIEEQNYDIKIAPDLLAHIKTLDQVEQPFGEGECMIPGPDGTNQGLGLGELDLDFGGFPGYTIPSGNSFDNACCVFYLVTPNVDLPAAFVAISEPWQIFKKDPGANFTNACAVKTPVSSSTISTPTTLPTSSSSATTPNVTFSVSPTSSIASYTTSTVYTTSIHTVTDCPRSMTNCPAHYTSVVTDVIALYTTVCPVTAIHTPPAYTTTTSTIYDTFVYTVTECPKSVYCPDHYKTVINTVYPVSTTVCVIPIKTEAVYYPTSTISTYAAAKYTPTYSASLAQFTGGADLAHKAVGVMGAGLAAVMGLALAL